MSDNYRNDLLEYLKGSDIDVIVYVEIKLNDVRDKR